MGTFTAELIKLRRSLAWPIVVLLPIVLVVAGAATQLTRGDRPADGWHTVWLQSVGFYGLFPLAIGVAVLGSLVWRIEHRGGNGTALMSSPARSLDIVVAKAAVVAMLTCVMQMILLVAVIAVGKIVFVLPGMLPGQYVGTAALLMVAAIPVAVAQSTLSMLFRSFAAPVAIGLVGCGLSTGALMAVGDVALVSPYALATRTALLGTGSFIDSGTVTGLDVVAILVSTAALTLVLTALHTVVLDHRDVRA